MVILGIVTEATCISQSNGRDFGLSFIAKVHEMFFLFAGEQFSSKIAGV